MPSKYIKLFLTEFQFSLRLVVIFVLIFAIFLFWRKPAMNIKEIEKLREQKKMVALIPQMKEKIEKYELSHQVFQKEQEQQKSLPVVNGIYIKDGIPSVLIGEEVYSKGENVNGYIICDVTSKSVILQDLEDGRKKEVFVSE